MIDFEINAFEINSEYISKSVYVYRVFYDPKVESIFSIAYRHTGIAIPSNSEIITFAPVDNDKFKLKEQKSFNQLTTDQQEKLILRLIRDYGLDEYGLSRTLEKRVRQPKYLKEYVIRPQLKINVIKHNGKFYLVIHVCHSIEAKKTLWEIVGKDKEELKQFLIENSDKILLKDIASKRTRGNAYKVKFENGEPSLIYDSDWVRYWYEYHEQKYDIPHEEMVKRFGDVDLTQPIIEAYPVVKYYQKAEPAKLLPQLIVPVYNAELLDEDEAKEVLEYTRLSPYERKAVILGLIQEINADIIKKDIVTVQAKYVSSKEDKSLIVRDANGNELPISEFEKSRRISTSFNVNKRDVFLPYEVPKILRLIKEIPTFIIFDSAVADDIKSYAINEIKDIIASIYYKKLRTSMKQAKMRVPFLNYSKKDSFEFDLASDSDIDEMLSQMHSIVKDHKLGLAIIVTRRKLSKDKFNEIKARLFRHNIFSQVINEDTFRDRETKKPNLELAVKYNILFQILSKLGIKYYALKRVFPYDYIIGVDVSPMETSMGYIGGSAVMFDSQGYIRKIIPVKIGDQKGESIDFKQFFKSMVDEFRNFGIQLREKKILLLRDGRITSAEEEGLKEISKLYNIDIVTIDLIKDHNIRALKNFSKIYFKFGDSCYLIPHRLPQKRLKGTLIPLKITNKRKIVNGTVKLVELMEDNIRDVYILTRLNYATIYADMRLPAPVHYAHQFVKALRKGWEINREFLSEGFLYFI